MKRVAIWLLGIAVIAAGVLVALSLFLSQSVVKERIAAQLSTLIGKQVQMNGEGTVSLWPFLHISYEDVVIGGKLASLDLQPLARMDGMDAHLSLTSAFWGGIRLSEITLVRPSFNLQVNGRGTDNWTIRSGPLADRLRLSPDARPDNLSLGRVRIVDGIVDYRNARNEAPARLTDVNGVFDWAAIDSAASAEFTAVWRGEVTKLSASVGAPFDLLRGEASQLTASFISKPVNFSYSGTLRLGATLVANGKMTAICPSPRRLLEWAGQPIAVANNVSETFLEGNFTAVGDTIEFQDATVRIGSHEGLGRFQLQREEGVPRINGTLAFETLWLPNPATLALQDADTTSTGKLDLSFLEGFGLDLRVSAEFATLEPFEVTNMAAAAIVRDGDASFEVVETDALGGTMAGSISVSKGKGVEFFETDLSLNAVDLGQLSTLYGTGNLAIEGTGNARFQLRSTGTSAHGLLVNLEGDGVIESGGGQIRGFDLSDLPLDATGRSEGPTSPFSGSTPYEELNVKFSVTNSSAIFDSNSIRSGSRMILLGGQVDLVRRSLALRGDITGETQDGTVSLPFFVGGNTTSPLFVMLPKSGPKPKPTD